MSAKDFPEEHRAIYNAAYMNGLEQGSGIEQKVYWTKGVDHGIELEQSRIIKILERQGSIADVDDVIAQIKGEK